MENQIPVLREIIDERKEKAIDTLSVSYAKNRLPLEEYERFVEYIHKIESERELVIVEKIVAEYDKTEKLAYSDGNSGNSGSRSGNSFIVLSSRTFSGPLDSTLKIVNILGSSHIKIRRSDLQKQRTDLNITTVLGECTIFVESGIRIINKAIPVLGGSWTSKKITTAENTELQVHISGIALLGSITVMPLKD